MALGNDVNKWAVAVIGLVVLGIIGVSFIPLVTSAFASHGAFYDATCTLANTTKPGYPSDNTSVFYCKSNSYSALFGLVPTLLIILFVVSLILGVIAMLKMGGKRR
jgi:hypothetical protein